MYVQTITEILGVPIVSFTLTTGLLVPDAICDQLLNVLANLGIGLDQQYAVHEPPVGDESGLRLGGLSSRESVVTTPLGL